MISQVPAPWLRFQTLGGGLFIKWRHFSRGSRSPPKSDEWTRGGCATVCQTHIVDPKWLSFWTASFKYRVLFYFWFCPKCSNASLNNLHRVGTILFKPNCSPTTFFVKKSPMTSWLDNKDSENFNRLTLMPYLAKEKEFQWDWLLIPCHLHNVES